MTEPFTDLCDKCRKWIRQDDLYTTKSGKTLHETCAIHPKNELNDLTPRDWIKETKSFFILDAGTEPEWKGRKEQHPATFPRTLAEKFIRNYTKEGMTVLDPMAGSGTTLFAAASLGRRAIGIDLYPKWRRVYEDILMSQYRHYEKLLSYRVGEVTEVIYDMVEEEQRKVDYIIFSPPYSNTLHQSSGGVVTRHKKRAAEGLDLDYGDHPDDLGNVDQESWLAALNDLQEHVWPLLRAGGHMTIVVQNIMRDTVDPIAWKLGLMMMNHQWEFRNERIWCQDSKSLGIWGHPKLLLSSNHHHYCLTFQKTGDLGDFLADDEIPEDLERRWL